eukprot:524591-Rhodomonas_salina.3
MSGTDLVYAATLSLCDVRENPNEVPDPKSVYRAGMGLRASYAMSGTDSAYAAVSTYATPGTVVALCCYRYWPTRCPVLTLRMLLPLLAYALSGIDVADAATRRYGRAEPAVV